MQRVRTVTATGSALLMVSLTLVARQQPAAPQQPPGPQQPTEQRHLQTPPMPLLPNNGLGETDQALIPGQPWRIRDLNRPKPIAVVPGRSVGDPPADALILFDGKDLSQWIVGGAGRGAAGAAAPTGVGWKVENGYMEVTPGVGGLTSKERFKDFQLHIEFASPGVALGISQVPRQQRRLDRGPRGPDPRQLQQRDLRGRLRRGGLQPVAAAREPLTPAWRVADVGHRLYGGALRRRPAGPESVHHDLHERRDGPQQPRGSAARRRPGARSGRSDWRAGWPGCKRCRRPRSGDPTGCRSAGLALRPSERHCRQCRALPERVGATCRRRVAVPAPASARWRARADRSLDRSTRGNRAFTGGIPARAREHVGQGAVSGARRK